VRIQELLRPCVAVPPPSLYRPSIRASDGLSITAPTQGGPKRQLTSSCVTKSCAAFGRVGGPSPCATTVAQLGQRGLGLWAFQLRKTTLFLRLLKPIARAAWHGRVARTPGTPQSVSVATSGPRFRSARFPCNAGPSSPWKPLGILRRFAQQSARAPHSSAQCATRRRFQVPHRLV